MAEGLCLGQAARCGGGPAAAFHVCTCVAAHVCASGLGSRPDDGSDGRRTGAGSAWCPACMGLLEEPWAHLAPDTVIGAGVWPSNRGAQEPRRPTAAAPRSAVQ